MVHTASAMSRRWDIDWLRILAVLLLIPYHTARIFDVWEINYIKNAELSNTLSYLIVFIGQWHMPLLFLLAGAATWYALGRRTMGRYAHERFLRLFVPFVFGVLIIVPPQAYLASLRELNHALSYFQFITNYFRLDGDLSGYTGQFTPAHLWFILYLFIFSLVTLPLVLFVKRDSRFVAWLVSSCEKPGMIHLLVIPLCISSMLPDVGGKNPFYFILIFIYGFLFVGDSHFYRLVERNKLSSLIIGLLTMSITTLVWALRLPIPDNSLQDVAFIMLRAFNTWLWLVAVLGYGQRYLSFTNKVQQYANEAAYPFYILHQTVIIVIGYFVVRWSVNLWIKFGVIALGSLAGTLLLYEVGVKRTNLTRFLFGMKLRY